MFHVEPGTGLFFFCSLKAETREFRGNITLTGPRGSEKLLFQRLLCFLGQGVHLWHCWDYWMNWPCRYLSLTAKEVSLLSVAHAWSLAQHECSSLDMHVRGQRDSVRVMQASSVCSQREREEAGVHKLLLTGSPKSADTGLCQEIFPSGFLLIQDVNTNPRLPKNLAKIIMANKEEVNWTDFFQSIKLLVKLCFLSWYLLKIIKRFSFLHLIMPYGIRSKNAVSFCDLKNWLL